MNKTLAGLLLATSAVPAVAAEPAEIWLRSERFVIEYKVNADGSNVRTYDQAYKIVHEKGLEQARSTTISHSTGVESAEILEAYTRKADGRRIKVPKSNYQVEVNKGQDGGAPAFSDRTNLTLVFPELALGDAVVLRHRIVQKEAIFPGHFSERMWFSRGYAFDDLRVVVDAPATLAARFEANGMEQKVSEAKGRRVVEWRWQNKDPVRITRRNWSALDIEKEVGFVYSTFDSYAQIAEAYGARARPKAEPTERVRKLADEIVGSRKDRKDQARALYDWVATKVGYAGNCIGVGVVVPRDQGFVLDNMMGDCKDHATLLQALLAAKGIPSTQALVNSGNSYRLARIPDVMAVNHVINYVPEWDLFLDSTSDSTPFGMLPMGVQDKPVLLVDGHRDGKKTPIAKPGSNRQHVKTVMDIYLDGTVKVTVDVAQNGLYAIGTREWAREMTQQQEADLIKNLLRGGGLTGTGTLAKDDPTELLDHYKFGATMEINRFVRRPGAGALPIMPLLGGAWGVAHYVGGALMTDTDYESACTDGSSVEEYVYRFPKGMEILSVPDNFKLSNDFLSYEATYQLKGRELRVKRSFDDRTQGNLCAPSIAVAYKEFAEKVLPNLQAQILYK